MNLFGELIELDKNGQPLPPQIILAYRNGTKIGTIYNATLPIIAQHLNSPDEISFEVQKRFNGVECDLWEEIRDFRFIYLPHFHKWYEITVTTVEGDSIVKNVSGIAVCEAELSQIMLNEIEINTEDDIAREDYDAEHPTVLYDPLYPKSSLLNRILSDKASHYEILHVDSSIRNLERTFSWDDTSIYDALMEVAEEMECLFVFGQYEGEDDGQVHRTISAYDMNDTCLQCGYRGEIDGECPECGSTSYLRRYGRDSRIFISKENLSPEITYETNADSIKNCFRLAPGDDDMLAAVRNCNPSGDSYIWYFSDQMYDDMSDGLETALKNYIEKTKEYNTTHEFTIPEEQLTAYNALVDKYSKYTDKYQKFTNPIVGYPQLVNLMYNVMDFTTYLQTSFLPAADKAEDTTAEKEWNRFIDNVRRNTSGVPSIGIDSKKTSISYAVANNAVIQSVKTYVDTSRYRITVDNSTYSAPNWNGQITLESYTDDEDTITSDELTIRINLNDEEYVKTQIDLVMSKIETDKVGIAPLLNADKTSIDDFKKYLKHYSVDGLMNIYNVAEAVTSVLGSSDVGIGDPSHKYYNTIYVPYKDRQDAVDEELKAREAEVRTLGYPAPRTSYESEGAVGIYKEIETIRNAAHEDMNIKNNLTERQWVELSSFRREQTYSNDNYISDGLNNAERIAKARDFYNTATKELVKAANIQHTITASLYDIYLAYTDTATDDAEMHLLYKDDNGVIDNIDTNDEYLIRLHNPLYNSMVSRFDIGNWIHLQVDDKIFKMRLTDCELDYDDLTNINVTFSDATKIGNYLSDTTTILKSAASISTSYSYFQRQAASGNEANRVVQSISQYGFNLNQQKIVNSSQDESLVMNSNGLLMRRKLDYEDGYDPEQVRIFNKGLYYTNDNWRTVGTGIGSFTYTDPETGEEVQDFGVIAKTIVGNLILGNNLGIYTENGSMKMNENGLILTSNEDGDNSDIFTVRRKNQDGTYDNYIYVNNAGEVIIDGSVVRVGHEDEEPMTITEYIDENLVPGADGADGVDGEDAISVVLDSSAGNIFKNKQIASVLTARIYRGAEDVTDDMIANGATFKWIKKDKDGVIDEDWSFTIAGNSIPISADDVNSKSVFLCEVYLPDEPEPEDDDDDEPEE